MADWQSPQYLTFEYLTAMAFVRSLPPAFLVSLARCSLVATSSLESSCFPPIARSLLSSYLLPPISLSCPSKPFHPPHHTHNANKFFGLFLSLSLSLSLFLSFSFSLFLSLSLSLSLSSTYNTPNIIYRYAILIRLGCFRVYFSIKVAIN
jgi:hypothetical protein